MHLGLLWGNSSVGEGLDIWTYGLSLREDGLLMVLCRNYDHVSSLWEHEKWLPQAAVDLARANYAAYMVRRTDGLRIITLNTDFWYRDNWFNYFNMTQKDTSGMLRFLTDELQDAEDAGDRGE